MKVGGLQPVTLLDYPKKVAAIVFTSGCGFRCPFCYNPHLVLPGLMKKNKNLKVNDSLDFLRKRKKYLDGVVITGGEPILQKGLSNFLRSLKKMGYLVKLDTNGFNPEILGELMKKKLVDYVAMDIKGPLDKYEKFCGIKLDRGKIKESIKLIKASGLDYEFRSTLVKGLHGKGDVKKMAQLIKGAKKYFLQNFNHPGKLVENKFKGRSFLPKEMEEFRQIIKPYAAECKTR
ncbi:MAG: anaerobic ribonucleoside-triphosphate reductase activating protein [Patescibacteria group bacterium]